VVWVSDKAYLLEISKGLRSAERIGNQSDNPEGTGWIQLSVVLALQIADRLEKIAEKVDT
jgi:hypothetical protein